MRFRSGPVRLPGKRPNRRGARCLPLSGRWQIQRSGSLRGAWPIAARGDSPNPSSTTASEDLRWDPSCRDGLGQRGRNHGWDTAAIFTELAQNGPLGVTAPRSAPIAHGRGPGVVYILRNPLPHLLCSLFLCYPSSRVNLGRP